MTLKINYGQSLEAMIAAGHYRWIDPNITSECFSVEGKGAAKFEPKVFHFGHEISPEIVVLAMKGEGWNPAKIEYLLAFGAKYPDEQCKYPIIGLGSVVSLRGRRRTPCLDQNRGARDLNLRWWKNKLNPRCRFLGVRPVSTLGLLAA